MAVSMTMTPFMALRRALRRLPSRRPALAAGAGVPPRFAGLATILEKCASRCQAATPPATRAVLLTPGGPRVLWTAAGVQLQRRAAALARPSSRRRARAAARGAAEELRGHQRRPHGVVARGTPGSSRSRRPPGRSAPRRRPWALRPARAGAAGCPPSRSLPGRRWCLFRHRLPLTPPGAWVTRRPARMARQAVEPPAGWLNPRVELPNPAPLALRPALWWPAACASALRARVGRRVARHLPAPLEALVRVDVAVALVRHRALHPHVRQEDLAARAHAPRGRCLIRPCCFPDRAGLVSQGARLLQSPNL